MKIQEIFQTSEDDLSSDDVGAFELDDPMSGSYKDYMFNPNNVHVDSDAQVSITKDAQNVQSGRWEDVWHWINDNWETLNGTYYINERGEVLYKFTVAN